MSTTTRPLPILGESGDSLIAAQILEHVRSAKRILVTGHERPDGDCIGSTAGLVAILRENGFEAEVVLADKVPGRYAFLTDGVPVRQSTEGEKFPHDLVIVVDSTDLSRLGKLKAEQFGAAKLIDIDHHLSNPNFGVVNFVDTKAAASVELVWRIAAQNGWRVPSVALECIYAGLITDTGQFSYSNTSPRALRMAAELVERGIDTERTWQRIFLNKTAGELELEKRARANLITRAGGRICSIALRTADFSETGTGPEHTEELASIPRSLAGVELALFMYEIQGGERTKVSVRTMRNLDARALAQKFGGGGHRQAAGCTVAGNLDAARPKVLDEAEAFLSTSAS